MTDELEAFEAPVMAEMPVPTLYAFPRVSRGTDPVPEAWHRAMKDAEEARGLFQEKHFDQAAEKYLAVAASLPETAAIGIYGGEFAMARGIAYQNAALAYRSGGLSTQGEQRLGAIDDPRARAELEQAIDLLSR